MSAVVLQVKTQNSKDEVTWEEKLLWGKVNKNKRQHIWVQKPLSWRLQIELKNSIVSFNLRMDQAEDRIGEFKDRSFEIKESEEHKEKKKKRKVKKAYMDYVIQLKETIYALLWFQKKRERRSRKFILNVMTDIR